MTEQEINKAIAEACAMTKHTTKAELKKLAERQRIRIIGLESAVGIAARIFREYEDMHRAKGKREKADANANQAKMLEKVLKGNQ